MIDMRASLARKGSASGESSRRSSLKLSSTSPDSFIDSLDEELQQKLESIGEDEADVKNSQASRVCDVIEEEK